MYSRQTAKSKQTEKRKMLHNKSIKCYNKWSTEHGAQKTQGGSGGRWWVAPRKRLRLGAERHTCLERKNMSELYNSRCGGDEKRPKAAAAGLHAEEQFWASCKLMWRPRKFSLTGLKVWAALQQQER